MCNALTSFKELQDENAMLKGTVKKYESRLNAMEHAMNNLMRRLIYYENPHGPPSQNLIPARQRKASSSKDSSGTSSTFDIHSTLNHVSHARFTPATDFEDSADIWNNVASSWWDFTRDDSNGDIDIRSSGMGWFTSTLAITNVIQSDGTMSWAQVTFNSDKDFRDARISTGWLSYDYETVAIHEIGHVAGIRHHTFTSGSPMSSYTQANHVDRTLSSHDISTIGSMY